MELPRGNEGRRPLFGLCFRRYLLHSHTISSRRQLLTTTLVRIRVIAMLYTDVKMFEKYLMDVYLLLLML